jgi:transposase
MRYELTDHEWTAIKPFLPNKPRGVPRVNDRRVLNGIFWVLRSGAPWRDLPTNFGPYTTCYNRFVRWRRAGVWGRIMTTLTRRQQNVLDGIGHRRPPACDARRAGRLEKMCDLILPTALLTPEARTNSDPNIFCKRFKLFENFGGRTRTRTLDPLIKSQLVF